MGLNAARLVLCADDLLQRLAGDLTQYYDQDNAHAARHTTELQDPLLLAGYRHEWSPGVYTLALAGRFDDKSSVSDTDQPVLILGKDGTGPVNAVPTPTLPTATLDYGSRLDMYSAEIQQIFQQETQTLVLGARYQDGRLDTQSALGASTPTFLANTTMMTATNFSSGPMSESVPTDFARVAGYGYFLWQVLDPLQLSAGISYDKLTFPVNFRSPPISSSQDSEQRISPKAGFTWTPTRDTTLRFAYTQSLGGVSFDQKRTARAEPDGRVHPVVPLANPGSGGRLDDGGEV